jgi:hypothetical protein
MTPPALWPSRWTGSRQPRLPRLGELYEGCQIADVVGELLDVEPLAARLAAAAVIQGVDGEPALQELLGHPLILTAVGIETVRDDDDAAGLARRPPGARKDANVANALEGLFSHGGVQPFQYCSRSQIKN